MNMNEALILLARKSTRLGRKLLYGDTCPFASHAAITKARLDHLASLNLDVSGRSVLEVGAGVGTLTKFFEERGCDVLSTDGNAENVAEMKRQYPWRKVKLLDIENTSKLPLDLDRFDVVFCYGILYHLSKPEATLKVLSEVCKAIILVETSVALGKYPGLYLVRDAAGRDQAVGGIGCRPTRSWVMNLLGKYFGHAYVTRTQPRHQAFPIDWRTPFVQPDYRAVFVGSKRRLSNPELSETLIDIQQYA